MERNKRHVMRYEYKQKANEQMGINTTKLAELAKSRQEDGVYSTNVTLTPSMPMVVTSRSIMSDVGGSRV